MSVGAVVGARAGALVADKSGTVTLGGTAQQLMAANPLRRGFFIQNQSTADMWINAKGATATAAEPSIWLPAGAAYSTDYGNVSLLAISIFGATTGQAFCAEEYT